MEDCNSGQCSELCNELVKHTQTSVVIYEVSDAKDILSSLRRKRYFDLMSKVAGAFLRSGLNNAQIRRQYAQSLLDRGNVYPALSLLNELLNENGVSKRERSEARGLTGRAYKQIYTDAYVIGHPKGGELSFSFQDNTLIEFDFQRMHYRSPTDPGSSGSPVFDHNWELIGLHHAGSEQMPRISGDGTHPANEGIALPAIKKEISTAL